MKAAIFILIMLVLLGDAAGASGFAAEARDAYDRAFAAYEARFPQPPDNEHGSMAWGEAAVLDGLLSMYKGTNDEAYLRKFVERARGVADLRDSVTGVKDYTGKSRPAWSSGGKYTFARAKIADSEGRPALDVRFTRSSQSFNSLLSLKPAGRNRYDLAVANEPLNKSETHVLRPARSSLDRINRNSTMVRLEDIGWLDSRSRLPEIKELKPEAERMCFSVHTGVIALPMARFAVIVKERKLVHLKLHADYLAEVARRALDSHESEWWESGDYGSYLYPVGCPFWADGAPVPQNYNCAIGRGYTYLWLLTGRERYRDRVAKIARTLRNDMESISAADGPYIWHYWWGPMVHGWKDGEWESVGLRGFGGGKQIEDVSHGALEVALACLAARIGVVFDEKDLDRLALTFSKNVVLSPEELSWRVDGSRAASPRTSLPPGWGHLLIARRDLLLLAEPFIRRIAERETPSIGNANAIGWYLMGRN